MNHNLINDVVRERTTSVTLKNDSTLGGEAMKMIFEVGKGICNTRPVKTYDMPIDDD